MKASNTGQLEIARTRANSGMESDQSGYSFKLFPDRVRCLEAILAPPRIKFADLCFREVAYFDVQRQDSLAASELLDHARKRHRLSSLALSDRFEQHAFGLGICLKGLLVLGKQDSYRRALRKVRIVQFNATINDPAGSDSHQRILAPPMRLIRRLRSCTQKRFARICVTSAQSADKASPTPRLRHRPPLFEIIHHEDQLVIVVAVEDFDIDA